MNSGCSRAFAVAAAVALVMTFGAGSAWGSGRSSGFRIHATPIAGLVRPISSEASVFGNRTPSRLFGAGGYQLGDTPFGGSPPVLYGGGAVMHAVTTHVIAWAPSGFSFPSGYVSGYAQYLSDLSHDLGYSSNVSSVLAQYVDASGRPLSSLTSAAPISDADSYPASGCHVSGASVCLTEVQVLAEAANQIASYGLSGNLNQSYILLLPPGVDSCYDANATECEGQAFCAYHTAFPLGKNAITYTTLTLVPYTGSSYNNTAGHCELPTGPGPADISPELIALESIGTHELFESATDPMIGSGYIDSTGYEIADECEFIYEPESSATPSGFYNQLLNGSQYLIQDMWSDEGNACARGETTTASASITAPQTVRTGSTARLSATLAADGASAAAYKWSYRDPLGENQLNVASGPNPQIMLRIVGTYTVWVTITDTAGATVTGVKNVAVGDSHRPAAWFTWSPAHPRAGMSVRFFPRGVGSTESITRYRWRFGSRGKSAWAIPSHVYATVGHHTVTLTVTQDGLTGRARRSIAVAARPPSPTRLGQAIALSGHQLDIASLLSNNGTRSTVSYGGAPGRIVITWDGTVKNRTIVVASGAQTVSSGGVAHVTIKLTAAGRVLLAKSRTKSRSRSRTRTRTIKLTVVGRFTSDGSIVTSSRTLTIKR
jgi:PKD repeat protein